MLRPGLTAAGLLLVTVVLAAGGRAEPARTQTKHTCSALDKQFLRAAALSSVSISAIGRDYQSGAVSAKEAIAETRDAALGLQMASPRDPSLKLARTLMRSMYVEYGRAIRAQWKGGDAGAHAYRSYSLANYVHQVLADAGPALGRVGCSVSSLL